MGLVGNHDLCLLQEFRTSGVFPRFWTRMLSMPPPRAVDGDHHAASSAHRYSEGSDFPSATQHRGLAATARSQRGGTYLGRSGGTRELDRPTSRDDLCRSTLRLDCHDVRSIWSARRVVSGECSPGSCRLQRQYSRQPCRYSRLHVGMLPRSATRDLVIGCRNSFSGVLLASCKGKTGPRNHLPALYLSAGVARLQRRQNLLVAVSKTHCRSDL